MGSVAGMSKRSNNEHRSRRSAILMVTCDAGRRPSDLGVRWLTIIYKYNGNQRHHISGTVLHSISRIAFCFCLELSAYTSDGDLRAEARLSFPLRR